MQGRNWPIRWGPCRAPGTPNHIPTAPGARHPAPTQQTGTLASGLRGRGKAWERLKGQMSKGQQLPRPGLWEGGGQPAADGARTADQTTGLKDMALDRVPRRVGVVGYGRLGESRTVCGSSPGPFLKPPTPCVRH